ncbi:Aro10 [Kluyveromyces lactis]|nr:Aro10 [Kluyveromyces lactis]
MSPVQLAETSLKTKSPRSDSPVHGQSTVVKNIPFGHYVFERLLNSGAKSIFGVPGDFNLPLLEYLYDEDLVANGLQWIGTCNELNGAYAADGYSRYTNKLGCVITTYGVGELSALNGVAGAFAEDVKVLHIVGVSPSRFRVNEQFRSHNVHHLVPAIDSQQPPNHQVYFDMVKDRVCCSSAFLDDINTAADKLDQVIADICKNSKPGYVFIPVDFADKLVSNKNLIQNPIIDVDTVIESSKDENATKIAGDRLLQWIYESNAPSVFSDLLVDRFNLRKELRQFIETADVWNYNSAMGKSTLDERNPKYLGLYKGAETGKEMQATVDSSDLILHFGPAKNEINCGYYSFHFNENARIIELSNNIIKFIDMNNKNASTVEEANFVSVLKYVNDNLDKSKLSLSYPPVPKSNHSCEFDNKDGITQKSLKEIIPNYFNDGDVLIVETGSFQFGVPNMQFAREMKYITQSFYLSIGMALPAALGVGCGMRDYPRSHIVDQALVPKDYIPRLILCEGDGAAQMTIQEFASYIRYKIPMEILVWNNNGYTVERAINGPTRSYNDIAPFKWTALLNVFGDFENKFNESVTVEKNSELVQLLNKWKSCKERVNIKLAEVMLPVMDIPQELDAMLVNGKPN